MPAKLVSLIGPPAAGKTTLAEALAAEAGARLVREDYAGNPFLASSYVGPDSARLPSQLYFLLSRVAQLSRSGWDAAGLIVSDYGFCQDDVFARLRLDDGDYRAYRQVLARCEPLVQPPEMSSSMNSTR